MTSLDPAQALGHLPRGLRDELLTEYTKITRNYSRGHWEAAELDGGRFCEIVYSIIKGCLDEDYPDSAHKPDDFPSACRNLGKADKTRWPQGLRLGIPKVLIGLYDIRNNRGVGHVGGVVDANHMDATFVLHAAQWVTAELVRQFNDTDVSTATQVVDALTDRTLPLIWEVGGKRRILDTDMPLADQTLLLLYGELGGVLDKTLARDLKQARLDNFKRVLRRLDTDVLVEYDSTSGMVHISPKGDKAVEERLLPNTV